MFEAKSGYIYNLEVYAGPHPTNTKHNTAFSVVDRLCYKIKGKGHCVCILTDGSPVQRSSTIYGLVRQIM